VVVMKRDERAVNPHPGGLGYFGRGQEWIA